MFMSSGNSTRTLLLDTRGSSMFPVTPQSLTSTHSAPSRCSQAAPSSPSLRLRSLGGLASSVPWNTANGFWLLSLPPTWFLTRWWRGTKRCPMPPIHPSGGENYPLSVNYLLGHLLHLNDVQVFLPKVVNGICLNRQNWIYYVVLE